MQLGALLPLGDIGGDPGVVREYAQAAEIMGIVYLSEQLPYIWLECQLK